MKIRENLHTILIGKQEGSGEEPFACSDSSLPVLEPTSQMRAIGMVDISDDNVPLHITYCIARKYSPVLDQFTLNQSCSLR